MRSWFAGECLGMTLAVTVACASVQSQTDPSAADAKTVQEFKEALQRYIDVHNKAEAGVPPLKKTDDPTEISGRERALALAIQTSRKGARQGEIFTPAVEPYFRRIIREDMRRRRRAELDGLLKDQTPVSVGVEGQRDLPDDAAAEDHAAASADEAAAVAGRSRIQARRTSHHHQGRSRQSHR